MNDRLCTKGYPWRRTIFENFNSLKSSFTINYNNIKSRGKLKKKNMNDRLISTNVQHVNILL